MTTKGYEYDYYNILNVPFNASDEEIKASYRKLAKVYHPDLGGSDFEFKKISQAYETLSDEYKRKKYNKWYEEKYTVHVKEEIPEVTVNIYDCVNHILFVEIRKKPKTSIVPPDTYTDENGEYFALKNRNGTIGEKLTFYKPDKWHNIVDSYFDYENTIKAEYTVKDEDISIDAYTKPTKLKPIHWIMIFFTIFIALLAISCNNSNTKYNKHNDKTANTYTENNILPEITAAASLDSEFTEEPLPADGEILYCYGYMYTPEMKLTDEQPTVAEINIKRKRLSYLKSPPSISSLKINLPDDDSNYYYIKVIEADTNNIIQSVFMYPGTTIEIPILTGSYEVRYACGKTWYGYENLFGYSGSYAICDDVFDFIEDYGWEVTLEAVINGNLDTEDINFEDF